MRVSHPEAFIAIQTGLSTLILGEPGVTKTRTMEAFAKSLGRRFECIVPSQRDPADIVGYPSISEVKIHGKTRRVADFVPARWRVEIEECAEGGFVLFDEILDCSPAHQAAIQQVLNDGITNCLIAGCGNPVDLSTNGFELGPAVVNRLVTLDYSAPIDEWKNNLMTDFTAVADQFPRLPDDWKKHIPEARGNVLGFLNKMPQQAQKCPANRADRGKPWPSLRSWTNAATLLAAAKSVGADKGIKMSLLKGTVGVAAAGQFFTWQDELDLPDVLDVLADPSCFDFGKRGDKTYAVLSAVIAYALATKDGDELDSDTWVQACRVLIHAAEKSLAMSSGMAVHLAKQRPKTKQPRYPDGFYERFKGIWEAASHR